MLILGFDELDDQSKTIVKKALQLQKFFSQNFYMTEHFTLKSGLFVKVGFLLNWKIQLVQLRKF